MMTDRERRLVLQMLAVVTAVSFFCFGSLWLYALRPLKALPQTSGPRISWSTEDWAHLPADGERCILANNVWNKSAMSRDFEQEIFAENIAGKRIMGWRWRAPWQLLPSIASYPELICGNKPWDQPIGIFDGLPFHPGEKHISANYNILLRATGTYNMAFSLWTVTELPSSPHSVSCEIMIWIANSGQKPSGLRRGTIAVDGVTYDIYINEHHHDASGVNKNEWTYAAFVARSPQLNGKLNLSAFLEDLQQKKILRPNQWLTDVELGNEVTEGSGIAEIENLALKIE
jgi:hypothetical protein